MTWSSLCCVLGSVLLLLAFLAAVVFVDPPAYFGSEDLDFCGLTSVFFTLGMLPLAFLLFSNDAKVNCVISSLLLVTLRMKFRMEYVWYLPHSASGRFGIKESGIFVV